MNDKKEKGLYRKYTVYKNDENGNPLDVKESIMFCLDERDPAAIAALIDYATYTSNDELALNLITGIGDLILNQEESYFKWDKSKAIDIEQLHMMLDAAWDRFAQ